MFNRHQQLDPLFNVQNLTVFWASIGIAPNATARLFTDMGVTCMPSSAEDIQIYVLEGSSSLCQLEPILLAVGGTDVCAVSVGMRGGISGF